jgi:hypothetical protein
VISLFRKFLENRLSIWIILLFGLVLIFYLYDPTLQIDPYSWLRTAENLFGSGETGTQHRNILFKISYHPHSGWFEEALPGRAINGEGSRGAMRTRHHFGLNVQVQLLLMTIFFFLLPNAAPYLSLIFDSLIDLGEFRGKSTYIQHPGTAEPFRIAPEEPVAYTNLVIIHDPKSRDLGTALRPTDGKGYFDKLK